MKSHTRSFRLTAMAAALYAAFGAAQAAEDSEVAALTRPESSVEAGIGHVTVDNREFGKYNGLNEQGVHGLFNADIIYRDDATGTWLKLRARNLGLESRELRFDHERQGDWGYYFEYNEITRHEPNQAYTGVSGIGGTRLTIPNPAARTGLVNLRTERDRFGLGLSKQLNDAWSIKVDFRNENKDGARLWGRGTTGGAGNFEFAPEPINSTIRQLDAVLNYSGERLHLSGGYYGTMYSNQHNGLDFIGGAAGLSTFTPLALPPDNFSHQLHVSGSYAFTPTTHGNFKLAYARAKQSDAFVSGVNVPLAPGIGNNLQGQVDTTLVQMGLTARPLPKLTLRGNFRYEDRDDQTPVLLYNTLAGPTSTFDGTNEPRSIRTTAGKVEASYALPMAFRLTGGIDYTEKERNTSVVRVVTFRKRTEEAAYRAELRRSLSDTITGALAYIYSDRDGSRFLTTTLNNGSVAASGNRVAPIHLADRQRHQVRMTLNWQALEALSVQLRVDGSADDYDQIHALGIGPRKGDARNFALDLAYSFSDRWQATAWASHNITKQKQAQHVGSGTAGLLWDANLKNNGDAVGLGFRGKPYSWLEVGGDLNYSNIKDSFDQNRLNAVSPGTVVAPLPDITTKITRLQLFAKYALQKNSGIRVDFIHDRFDTNDWTWANWTYTDGTRLLQDSLQKTNFVGVSYFYRWQ